MDHTRLAALRQEAERQLHQELLARYPSLAAAFTVRLTDRPTCDGSEPTAADSTDYIDW
jgi:hypothetical protein